MLVLTSHIVRHGISTHISYLACHYRRNTSDNLPRDMPTVIDESVEVRVMEPDDDTERERRSDHQLDVIPYFMCLCELYCV